MSRQVIILTIFVWLDLCRNTSSGISEPFEMLTRDMLKMDTVTANTNWLQCTFFSTKMYRTVRMLLATFVLFNLAIVLPLVSCVLIRPCERPVLFALSDLQHANYSCQSSRLLTMASLKKLVEGLIMTSCFPHWSAN